MEFTCAVCGGMYTDPITIPSCGHTECGMCYDETKSCALCNAKKPRVKPKVSLAIESIILQRAGVLKMQQHAPPEKITKEAIPILENNQTGEKNIAFKITNSVWFKVFGVGVNIVMFIMAYVMFRSF